MLGPFRCGRRRCRRRLAFDRPNEPSRRYAGAGEHRRAARLSNCAGGVSASAMASSSSTPLPWASQHVPLPHVVPSLADLALDSLAAAPENITLTIVNSTDVHLAVALLRPERADAGGRAAAAWSFFLAAGGVRRLRRVALCSASMGCASSLFANLLYRSDLLRRSD